MGNLQMCITCVFGKYSNIQIAGSFNRFVVTAFSVFLFFQHFTFSSTYFCFNIFLLRPISVSHSYVSTFPFGCFTAADECEMIVLPLSLFLCLCVCVCCLFMRSVWCFSIESEMARASVCARARFETANSASITEISHLYRLKIEHKKNT